MEAPYEAAEAVVPVNSSGVLRDAVTAAPADELYSVSWNIVDDQRHSQAQEHFVAVGIRVAAAAFADPTCDQQPAAGVSSARSTNGSTVADAASSPDSVYDWPTAVDASSGASALGRSVVGVANLLALVLGYRHAAATAVA